MRARGHSGRGRCREARRRAPRRGAPRHDPRVPRSHRRDGHPAGGAATPPPPPPSPGHGQRPPARCPSPSSWAAPRLSKRSPPSLLVPASAARRLMYTDCFASEPELVQEIAVLEELALVLAIDLMEQV